MQVAEILVRRTIRFVFFLGRGKKGPRPKRNLQKWKIKRRKEEKRTFHAGRRGFVTFSLSLSLSLVHFFRYFSSEPPLLGFLKDFVCKKKRKKGTRLVIGRRRPMGSLDFFFAWLFYLSTRETFVCSVCLFFFVFLSFSNAVSDWLSATWPNQSGASFHWESSMGSANGTVSTMRDPVKNNSIKRRNSGRSFLLPVRMIFNHGQDDDEKLGKRTTR